MIDLYRRFEKDSVSSILDAMLDGSMDELEEEPSIIDANKLQGLSRSAALFTEGELNNLVTFLQSVNSVAAAASANQDDTAAASNGVVAPSVAPATAFDQKQLNDMLSQLPSSVLSASKTTNNASPETPNKRGGLLGKGELVFFVSQYVGRGPVATTNSLFDNSESRSGDENIWKQFGVGYWRRCEWSFWRGG